MVDDYAHLGEDFLNRRLNVQIDRTQRIYRLSKDDYGPIPSGGRGPLRSHH